MAIELTKLPYAYNALEPHIDAQTLEIHHSKHHKGYVDKANAALANTALAGADAEQIVKDYAKVPENIRAGVINTVGQSYNHDFYWKSMSPDGGGEPDGDLADAIYSAWGSFAEFRDAFSAAAAAQFGSGWAWISLDKGKLKIEGSSNADTPLAHGRTPLLVIDVWEHAYYLKYQNRRPDYISAWWNLVNWAEVARRFGSAE